MQNFYSKKLSGIITGIMFFLLLTISVFGKNSLDERIFLSCEAQDNLKEKLQEGYRAFLYTYDTSSYDSILKELNTFLSKNPEEIVILLLEGKSPDFPGKITQELVGKYLAIPAEQSLDDLADCLSKDKRLFVFTKNSTPFSFSTNDYVCKYHIPEMFPEEISIGFTANPQNNLVVFNFDSVVHKLPDSLQNKQELIPQLFNQYTGKLPNIFVTQNKNTFFNYKEWFDEQLWYTADAEYNGEPLTEVRWKEIPEMLSYGKIHTTQQRLSPYKDGFHFSPDVFNFNRETLSNTKVFYARQRNLKDEMVLYLSFEGNTNNLVSENTQVPYSNISYKKDPERGLCGHFSNRDNYIDFDKSIVFHENFTVSVWVKPAEIEGNRSIIGKGKALSIKFLDGRMLFTSPDIMDHVMDSAVVETNQWQHLSYVISSGQTVKFYKNGRLIDRQKAERIEPTEHSLLIGTNLWDESFNGYMDDLMIWNRNLSDEEIERIYNEGIEREEQSESKFYLLGFILLAVFGILLHIRSARKKKRGGSRHQRIISGNIDFNEKGLTPINAPAIELFGGFKMQNRKGKDLTSGFSPRRKQIFILVLIKTILEKGITSKQLTDFLWAGYSSASAKNNRSTQVQRIRETLATDSGINILYVDKKWLIELETYVYCDLAEYFQWMEEFKKSLGKEINLEVLSKILAIIQKGTLLPNMDDEWLDDFKSKTNDDLLNTLLPLFQNKEFTNNKEWELRLSRVLLIFDPLNEQLLKHQINALTYLGKNTQASESLEHFAKVYQQCYDEPYAKSISEILNSELSN